MKSNYKTFSGGYSFKNFKGQPCKELIQIKMPGEIIIPLKQGFGNEVPAIVKTGDKVKAGQIIGVDDNSISSPVHSSVNGTVEKMEKIDLNNDEVNAVIIKSAKTDDWLAIEGHTSDWKNYSPKAIEKIIYSSGAASLDKCGIPTRYKSSTINPGDVKDVIIQAANSEIFNPCLSVLLDENKIPDFIQGLGILKKIFPDAKMHLAFSKCNKKLLKKIAGLMVDSLWANFYSVAPKYPQAYDEAIIPTILNKEFPPDKLSADIGVIVLSIQTILHVFEAVVEGKPAIERTVTLSGEGFKENIHATARIGTPFSEIINNRIKEGLEVRIIADSILTGNKLLDLSLPIIRTLNNIIAIPENRRGAFVGFANPGFTKDSYSRTTLSPLFGPLGLKKKVETNLHGEKRACVFCAFCEDACPAGIMPHHLYRYAAKGIIDENLLKYKIYNCMECNLCSYVCTSKIPVARYIKEAKAKLKEFGLTVESTKPSDINKSKSIKNQEKKEGK